MWDSIVINMYGVRISVVAVAHLESLQFLAFIINDNGDMTSRINLLTAGRTDRASYVTEI